ncbi:MAG: hypothetical protein KH290_12765, partial [Roseburia sp.]|nr:hypothetical protein [Roseburia sp.]
MKRAKKPTREQKELIAKQGLLPKNWMVILDDKKEETICKKSRFQIIEDGEIAKKAKATITELTYQIENDFSDIKSFNIRKNS